MRHRRALTAVVLALVAVALVLTACGDDDEATTSPAPAKDPSGEAAPSPSPGGLPPQLLECFKRRGYEVTSPTEIHSAPPQVVQECFGALHGGGGVP